MGRGLSADDIAERIGVSRAAVYRLEKGELVKIETIEKLAELLDVSLPFADGHRGRVLQQCDLVLRAHAPA
ncbi:MAG: helix-turn-helix domain-containing protein [Xanthobacteraceae bacterium]|nr:helix-turn-helix domain-containing protein [Xanthobacteraceae bacterium]